MNIVINRIYCRAVRKENPVIVLKSFKVPVLNFADEIFTHSFTANDCNQINVLTKFKYSF